MMHGDVAYFVLFSHFIAPSAEQTHRSIFALNEFESQGSVIAHKSIGLGLNDCHESVYRIAAETCREFSNTRHTKTAITTSTLHNEFDTQITENLH